MIASNNVLKSGGGYALILSTSRRLVFQLALVLLDSALFGSGNIRRRTTSKIFGNSSSEHMSPFPSLYCPLVSRCSSVMASCATQPSRPDLFLNQSLIIGMPRIRSTVVSVFFSSGNRFRRRATKSEDIDVGRVVAIFVLFLLMTE